jgi:hypothetical protein
MNRFIIIIMFGRKPNDLRLNPQHLKFSKDFYIRSIDKLFNFFFRNLILNVYLT